MRWEQRIARRGARRQARGRRGGAALRSPRRAPGAARGRRGAGGVGRARAPTTTPVAWSSSRPLPSVAAGWMSTANTSLRASAGRQPLGPAAWRGGAVKVLAAKRSSSPQRLLLPPSAAGARDFSGAGGRGHLMRLCSARAITFWPRSHSWCAMRCTCAGRPQLGMQAKHARARSPGRAAAASAERLQHSAGHLQHDRRRAAGAAPARRGSPCSTAAPTSTCRTPGPAAAHRLFGSSALQQSGAAGCSARCAAGSGRQRLAPCMGQGMAGPERARSR